MTAARPNTAPECLKKTIDTITARQIVRHFVNSRVLFDVPERITNANSKSLYVPEKAWQRPGSDHSHLKSRGFI